MRVIAISTLRRFWDDPQHANAEQPLKAWYAEACQARWDQPAAIKAQYRSASFVGNNRVVFNIAGNKYRLVVAFAYKIQVAYVKFIGTHAAYDEIDAATVELD
jgi:mRNA interferase HigB